MVKLVPLKKIHLIFLFVISSNLFATETCNDPQFPAGSCYTTGYICGLAYDMNSNVSTSTKRILNFHIGKTANCSEYETTTLLGNSIPLRIFYFLDENESADALNMVMSGSIALSAANHRFPVNVIYKTKTGITNGVFLIAIQQREY